MREHKKTMILKYTRLTRAILLLLFGCLATVAWSQIKRGQIIDKIVAKVDNYIVLKSEVDKTYLEFLSRGQTGSGDIKCQIFESMVMDKVMVAKAEIDSVIVSDDEVDSNLDRRFRIMVAQVGSVEDIERYYGKTIEQFKEELRESIKEQLTVQRMEGEVTQDLKVTPAEVKKIL